MRYVDNPPNPYVAAHHEWLELPPPVQIEVYEERAKSILSENDSPDVGFRWSVNPYRGCQHGCIYCYARPTHEYLGFGAGTDFDTKLVVKTNAPELLEEALSARKWQGELVAFSGVTDCYQPLEACYHLSRSCLDVCRRLHNPVAIVTKSYLVMRDADLLLDLHHRAGCQVLFSIPFADAETARLIEPGAPTPARRFEAMARLAARGVPVGIMVAPIIPGLNDNAIPELLSRAADCGATHAHYIALRLPGSVRDVFLTRLNEVMPLRYTRIRNRIQDMRGGRLNETRFGHRMRGEGEYWESITRLFEVAAQRRGLNKPFRRPQSQNGNAPLKTSALLMQKSQLNLPFT